MVRKLAGYGAGLIALYLIVANGSKAGAVFSDGATGSAKVIQAFQGR